jgi:ESX-1-secreted protein regulator
MAADRPKPTLADRLERLFRSVHPAGHGEYTYREVAEAIREAGGPSISPTYLWQLRAGRRLNPSMRQIEAIARFFGVPVTYFSDDEAAARIDAELDFVAALRDASVRQIALRAAGLSPKGLAAIAEIVEQVRRLEGLPDESAGPPGGLASPTEPPEPGTPSG